MAVRSTYKTQQKQNKLTQIVDLIPENSILSAIIKDRQLNNETYLIELLSCRIYKDKNLDIYSDCKFDVINFMDNKNRDFIIAELTPETKSRITKIMNSSFSLNLDSPAKTKLYLDWYGLATDNYYDFMMHKFDNWYFTPQIQNKLLQTQLQAPSQNKLCYITDKPNINGIIINEQLDSNDFIIRFLEYLQISSKSQIDTIWSIRYEQIIISFVDNGQEFLFYYNRY
jgi:hypothetical protein